MAGTASGFVSAPAFTVNGTYVPFAGNFTGDTKQDVFFYAAGSAGDVLLVGK